MKIVNIKKTDFAEVSPIWRNKLWDHRYNFEPTSCMLYLGGYDGEIPQKYSAVFFAALIEDRVAGVISGHASSNEHFRMRGLYVEEANRRQGISTLLIQACIEEARKLNYKLIWATPRRDSIHCFEKLGFIRTSEYTSEGFLYGPNCYVSFKIN